MENCFPKEFWKMKILKVCGARKPKKAIFECSHHQILLKVGTLLHFSRCYTVVRRKLKLGLVTWFQISKLHFFTIFIDTPRPTLTYAYRKASLQCYFRDYYLQVNWTKRTEVTPFQSLTFRQIDYLVVILSIVKSKPNTMKILNFGNQWTIIRSFSNLVLN